MKKLTCILFVALLAAMSGGCVLHSTADEPIDAMGLATRDMGDAAELSADQLEQMADSQYAQGDYELAFVNYNRALTLEPENKDLLVKRGRVLAARKMDEQALKVFQDVLAEDPDHALANECAGEVYFESGLLDEAMAAFNRSLASNPNMWRSHTFIGIIHDREGDANAALESFEKALSINPGNAEVLNNIGVARLMVGDNMGAQLAFRQAISQGEADDRTYNNLGMSLARMGHLREALEAFRYGGDDATAHNNLGYVLLSQGRASESIPYFQRAIELSPAYYEKAFENMKHARVLARNAIEHGEQGYVKPVYGASVAMGSRNGPVVTLAGNSAVAPAQKAPSHGLVKVADLPAATASTPQSSVVPKPVVHTSKATSTVVTAPVAQPAAAKPAAGQSVSHASGPGYYAIQVSSWREEVNARKHSEEISAKGGKAHVVRVDLGESGVWFKVVVGRYGTKQEADADSERVAAKLGLSDARVTTVQESNLAANEHEEANL